MNELFFAQSELEKYYYLVTKTYPKNIVLRVNHQLKKLFSKEINEFDDAYQINIKNGSGEIQGINFRSVLLGVYSFFDHIGCRFLGPSNELIVSKKLEDLNACFTVVPKNRHRTICIEGASSFENCLDMINWAPKVGFNGYFIQFQIPHEFFARWYEHQRNDFLEKEEFSVEKTLLYTKQLIDEIKKRHLIYHAVGHGWTSVSIGMKASGWYTSDIKDLNEDSKNLLALINQERNFFHGVPLNTQLCYSNPEVRRRLVNSVVDYITTHPEIDILHFWLADNFNNFCECSECQKLLPSEYYVEILNDIDERLTAIKNNAKIVFLIYFELLWKPKFNRIKNPSRFIMMFAPITRTYTSPYLKDGKMPDKKDMVVPPFNLNKNKYSDKISDNLAFLTDWQTIYQGDSFLFDYHLMWDEFKDIQGMKLSKVLYGDIRSLSILKLNGLVSCQVQRNFFPTGFSMFLMGKLLVNPDIRYDEIKEDYFSSAFGIYGKTVIEMLEEQSNLFSFAYMRSEVAMINKKLSDNFDEAKKSCIKYQDIFNNLEINDLHIENNIKIIQFYLEYASILAENLQKKSEGETVENLMNEFSKLNHFVFNNEAMVQKVMDTFYFNLIIGDFIKAVW